jgi:hypothetical protein
MASPDYTLADLIRADARQSAPALVAGVPVLLANQGLRAAVFSTIKGAVHVLVGLSGWQEAPSSALVHFIGDQVELALWQGQDATPETIEIALAGRAAVEHILSSATVIDGAVDAVETAVSTFLDHPGVGAALATAANSVAQALADGAWEPQAVFEAAIEVLRANLNVGAAVGQALKDGVHSFVTDAGNLNEISSNIKTFVIGVATNPVVKAAIILRMGVNYGGAILGVLNDAGAMEKLADSIATVLPNFLQARGVADALGEALNQIAIAVANNGWSSDAIHGIVAGLQANPAIKAAQSATVSGAVRGILSVQALGRAVTKIAGFAVHGVFARSPLKNSIIDQLAVNAVKSLVYSLMGDGSVRALISGLAGDFATGRSTAAVMRSFIDSALSSPTAQMAVGMAVGHAVGSMFGAPFGSLVAPFVGIPTGLFIAVNAVPALLILRSGVVDAVLGALSNALPKPAPKTA